MPYDKNTPLFPISVAGKMVGVTTKMLRIYEEAGLLLPQRTPNTAKIKGRRLYSQNDIEYIASLRLLMQEGFTIDNLNLLYSFWLHKNPNNKPVKTEFLEELSNFVKANKES